MLIFFINFRFGSEVFFNRTRNCVTEVDKVLSSYIKVLKKFSLSYTPRMLLMKMSLAMDVLVKFWKAAYIQYVPYTS